MNSITKGEKDAIDWGLLITYKCASKVIESKAH